MNECLKNQEAPLSTWPREAILDTTSWIVYFTLCDERIPPYFKSASKSSTGLVHQKRLIQKLLPERCIDWPRLIRQTVLHIHRLLPSGCDLRSLAEMSGRIDPDSRLNGKSPKRTSACEVPLAYYSYSYPMGVRGQLVSPEPRSILQTSSSESSAALTQLAIGASR